MSTLKSSLISFLESPFFPLCIPPVLAVLQFLIFCLLMTIGFPEIKPAEKTQAGILITAALSLSFLALFGLGWSIKQVLYGKHKIAATLGAVFNGGYFLGFLLFFLGIFVTHASN